MIRRSFLSSLVGMAASIPVIGQSAILEKGKAIVCDSGSTKCPNGHETCYTINAPLAVGSGTYQNPEVAALSAKIVLECDVCHVLFIKQ